MTSPRRIAFRLIVALLSVTLLSTVFVDSLAAVELQRSQGVIAADKPWRMSWYSVDSGENGPTVLVVGGVHGNEPAGYRAAEQIRHWSIARGKLIVVPQVNRLGLLADMRWLPAHRNDRKLKDPNRNFPTQSEKDPRSEHCSDLWEFVTDLRPDWVFDLHEGFDFHHANSKSVGSSVITFPAADTKSVATLMVDTINRTIEDKEKVFDLLAKSGPVNGSLARACHEQLNARSFIVETTYKDQPLSKRTRQHRVMMSAAFLDIGLIVEPQHDQLVGSDDEIIRVAMYDATGTGSSKNNVAKLIDNSSGMEVAFVGPEEMRKEVLNQFNVVLFPGGSGSKQGRAIGEDGRAAVKGFIRRGGGIVVICAGAYLCSSHYDWSLHVINTSVYNETIDIPDVGRKSMWYRGGPAEIKVEFTAGSKDIVAVDGTHVIRYQNGPIISRGKNEQLDDYKVLAHFRSENAKYQPQVGTMVDTPAIAASNFGAGRVVSISPHFESTKGMEQIVARLIKFSYREE